MAQKQFGIIPHDTSQVGHGQDTPIPGTRHVEDQKEGFVKSMVKKIMAHRKKKEKKPVKKPEEGMKATESAIQKRKRREREELHGTSK
jgi:hypothetical protein